MCSGDDKSFKLESTDFRHQVWCGRLYRHPHLTRKGPHYERIGFFGGSPRSSVPQTVAIPVACQPGDYAKAIRRAAPVKCILMHDRHPDHESTVTQRCIKELMHGKRKRILDPPCATDLNPMKNL
jgi:hypothetical protein